MFARESTEKESANDFHAILKAKSRTEKENPDNCQIFITWHSTSQILLMLSLLRRKLASGLPSFGCETSWLIHGYPAR